jgi:hypothetical protein
VPCFFIDGIAYKPIVKSQGNLHEYSCGYAPSHWQLSKNLTQPGNTLYRACRPLYVPPV